MRKLLLLVAVVIATTTAAVSDECGGINRRDADRLITFLQSNVGKEPVPGCVFVALRALAQLRSIPITAADVLTEYLDKKEPPTKKEQAGFYIQLPTIGTEYPAASALFAIGKPALPALLKAVKSEQSSETRKQNAVYALMSINRDDPAAGIRLLRSEEATSKDELEARRLNQAARDALRWCAVKKQVCEAALNDTQAK